MAIESEFRLKIQERNESGPVLEGFQFTIESIHSLGRLHIDYRKDLGEKILCLHIAIPRDTPGDPRTWSVYEDFYKKPQGEQ